MAGVMITPASVPVVPGGSGTCSVRVRNTGAVVDSFTVSVLGEAAGWTTVAPPLLSLFPGSEGTVELHFAPPRKPGLTAGALPFGVRVVPSEDPDDSVVEEGELEVLAFQELTARITPRTSEAKRRARHDIVVDNRGNAPLEVALAASDPDEQLAFDLRPDTLAVPPGQSARASLKVAARKGFARGADKHRPFQVKVKTGPADPPTLLDATLVQKAGLPGFVFPLVAGVVALALIAAVLPGLRKEGGSGIFTLTGGKEATTTTAVAGDEGPVEDPEQAAAELEAAIAREMAANGQDPGAAGAEPGSSGTQEQVVEVAGAGATVAAAGQPPEPDTSGGAGEAEAGSAAPATPVATTAKPAPGATPTTTTTTTTTAPPAYAKWAGTWMNVNSASREQPKAVIRHDSTHIYVHGYGSCTPTYCDWGEARTTVTDGNDNTIYVTYDFGFKTTAQKITYLSASQIRIQSTHRDSGGGLMRTSDETFNRSR